MNVKTWFADIEINEDGSVAECSPCTQDVQQLAKRLLVFQADPKQIPLASFDPVKKAIECGFVSGKTEYYSLLQQTCIAATRLKIKNSYSPDLRIIHAVEALDDIDEAANLLAERLGIWYGEHFPEAGMLTENLAKFVAENGLRQDLPQDSQFRETALSSVGMEMDAEDGAIIKAFAADLSSLYERRHVIESYIRKNMEQLAPNLEKVAGANLGARLISMAGGLQSLSRMPSSTIQVMGANQALFKHLRGKATSPKHGIIFNHPLIKNSHPKIRGKMARALASSLSIASRVDAFSGRLNPVIKEKLDRKVLSIKEGDK
ncbi:Pre-mRNA processing ribonucleoprotein, binding domain protein [Methanohalophilus mahii DSM 5219]|uniref:Pre-mRNA processing ribonucleoprotein, binding domain protein n=1 Tax=Methanohalophilus mahii (strain ATCC 35705 / DSM 5219 / SLP) TaxID=547558 RepID=D5E920_METMS|nr:Pre-mRNA processing ribonucleoprotein, binding domain protein [Methanohalophilus mahii DSM 5219]